MSTLTNPKTTAVYDAKDDRIILAFRDGRDSSVIEIDSDAVPALLHSLNEARRDAKAARRPVAIPPPMIRPTTCPAPKPPAVAGPDVAPPDHRPIRLAGRAYGGAR